VVEIVTADASAAAQASAAGGLKRAGLRQEDRVAVLQPASGAVLAVVLGALRTGIVPVLLDPDLPAGERADLLADCRPGLVVDSPAALAEVLDAPPVPLARAPLARPMHYTSGTTGRRKGVWSGILSDDDAASLLGEERDLWGFHAGDRHLVFSPLHHSAPLRFATGTLLAGGTVLLAGKSIVDALRNHAPTTAFCVPTHLRRLFAPGQPRPPFDSFRLLAHAGEACPDGLKREVVAAFPAGSVYEFYGSTEGQFTVCTTDEWRARPGTVGQARPGRRLRVDEHSVIWCATPRYARFEYWGDPEKSARAWHGDEFTVGDAGRLDPDGYLYLDGRRSDLVITGGVNVYPLEVERVLAGCPGVEELVVFGVDDPDWGQRLCAAVVGPVTPETLDRFAREHLPAARRPKEYRMMVTLPRTNTGKIRRAAL
jgi:acyl-CoA synthetase (AMP-forming)/AMP-acid ligase II